MAMTTEQKIQNNLQLNKEDCRYMAKRTFNLMKYIVDNIFDGDYVISQSEVMNDCISIARQLLGVE